MDIKTNIKMDINLSDFVKASEHKQKIENILNNKDLPENYYSIEYTQHSLITNLRTLTVELLVHPEWFKFFKKIEPLLKKNCNTFTVVSVNEILRNY
jgi:hypothetical protein